MKIMCIGVTLAFAGLFSIVFVALGIWDITGVYASTILFFIAGLCVGYSIYLEVIK